MTTIYAIHAPTAERLAAGTAELATLGANWAETVYTAGEVAGKLFSPTQAVPYSFEAA